MSPEEIVALVDFRYLSDALTPEQALEVLKGSARGKEVRADEIERVGFLYNSQEHKHRAVFDLGREGLNIL